jgi:hypothetical protein
LIVGVKYVISEPSMDYYIYLDPLPFLSMVEGGAYIKGKGNKKGGSSCCTYLSLVEIVIHRYIVVL